MANKKSILFYLDNYTPALKKLSYEQKGMLFDAIIAEGGGIADMPELDLLLEMAFDHIKAAMGRDEIKYQQVCERNKQNGKKGGRPKKNPDEPNGTQDNPENPSGFLENPEEPKKADTDTDTGTTQKRKRNIFTPPSVEEVKEYCSERGNGIDPEYFVAHYESVNWMRGNNKIKNWKQCVVTWEKRNNKQEQTQNDLFVGGV